VAEYRRALVPLAYGRVLEVGIGSGLNLPFYPDAAEWIIGLDPSTELLRRAAGRVVGSRRPVRLVRASAEAIPLADRSVDTIVMTWMLCSIPDPSAALREMRRVLRPDGQLLFAEHGLAPEAHIARWQHRLDPLWARLSCHLDRDMDDLIRGSGFRITEIETGYLDRGPKPLTFMYRGRARPASYGGGEDGAADVAPLDLPTMGMPICRGTTDPSSGSAAS
jgi:SAM-dependent methyltransferase